LSTELLEYITITLASGKIPLAGLHLIKQIVQNKPSTVNKPYDASRIGKWYFFSATPHTFARRRNQMQVFNNSSKRAVE
jgi:hypothetical protein